jgi:hypothetical protein
MDEVLVQWRRRRRTAVLFAAIMVMQRYFS